MLRAQAQPTATAAAQPASSEEASAQAAETGPPASTTAQPPEPVAVEPVVAGLLGDCRGKRAIVVHKAARQMELHCGGRVAARFPVSLGFAPDGHKHHEGDGRTPEGEYYITFKFPSQFHRSLELSYPNIRDAERGLEEGQISRLEHTRIVSAIKRCARPPQNTALGSLLQIHGGGGGPKIGDWTLGCVATQNESIEQVFAFHLPGCTSDGTPRTVVHVKP